MSIVVLSPEERRFRHLECLELQASQWELFPCEAYADIRADYVPLGIQASLQPSRVAQMFVAAAKVVRALRDAVAYR